MAQRLYTALLSLFLAVTALFAQDDPNRVRGISTVTSYDVSELDSVNLFNGNLTLRIPIGQTYPVDGILSYGLTLYFNSNVWDLEAGLEGSTVAEPDPYANSGVGWRLSLGELYAPMTAPDRTNSSWILVEGDGTKREFADELHFGDDPDVLPPGVSEVRYSTDGSYLRLKVTASERTVESPSGLTRVFDLDGRLVRIEDPFGNWVSISYQTNPLKWTLTDKHGRVHRVQFEATGILEMPWIVDFVDLQAFNGTRAIYDFQYQTPHPFISYHPLHTDPNQNQVIQLPILERIALPEPGLDYEMVHNTTGFSGTLASLTLPTLGRYEYTYRFYDFTGGDIFSRSEGVANRIRIDADGTEIGRWTYTNGPISLNPGTTATIVSTFVGASEFFDTVNYFVADRFVFGHGLPFNPADPEGTGETIRYLSREVWPGAAGNGTALRRELVRYTGGGGTRLEYRRTEYLDDGDTFADVLLSNFDGLGHYRTSTTGGNFVAANERVTTVNYNPEAGIFDYDANTDTMVENTFEQIDASEPWLLETFTHRVVTESPYSERQDYCFDAATGYLEGVRTRAGSGLSASDLVQRTESLGTLSPREEVKGVATAIER